MPPFAGQVVDAVRTEGEHLATEYFDIAVGRIVESQGPRFNYIARRDVEAMLRSDYTTNEAIATGISQADITILPILIAGGQFMVCIVEQDLRIAIRAYLFCPSGSDEHLQHAQPHVDAFVNAYLPTSQKRNFYLIRSAVSLQVAIQDSGIHSFFAVVSVISRKPVCSTIHVGVARHLLAAILRAEAAFPIIVDHHEQDQASDLEQLTLENQDVTSTKQLLERV
ncbi:hypothetical protein LY78DRAFT_687051 [Colletotrichum sublineola]|nr:hypothetical protein LY78DRAFT_687051 [Colletotrichum sublineola]